MLACNAGSLRLVSSRTAASVCCTDRGITTDAGARFDSWRAVVRGCLRLGGCLGVPGATCWRLYGRLHRKLRMQLPVLVETVASAVVCTSRWSGQRPGCSRPRRPDGIVALCRPLRQGFGRLGLPVLHGRFCHACASEASSASVSLGCAIAVVGSRRCVRRFARSSRARPRP